jgi:quercetin dioxygenase-like cupin family protein
VQVLSGSCNLTLPDGVRLLKAGDLLHLPPGLPHAVSALEDLVLLLTQASGPKN